jgi:hypothetical protein
MDTTGGMTMTTYYAVCDVNGPISHRLAAETVDAAVAEFACANVRAWIDRADTHAEDDMEIEGGDRMSEDEFAAALEGAGATMVCDLDPVVNAHAGTVAHLAGGWRLWAVG